MAATPRLQTLAPMVPALNTAIAPQAPKVADPFYTSAAWLSLTAKLKHERRSQCEECGRRNVRLFGDHVRELKDYGEKLDPRNIRILCGSCHTAKTNRARAARMASPASVARRQQRPGGEAKG